MSTQNNLLIALGLIFINAIFIYLFKYRKKKYGIYSTGILITILVGYLFYYTIPFKGSIDEKQRLFKMENERIEEDKYNNTQKIASDILQEERRIKDHLNNLDKLLRVATIQSVLCLCLCLWGLIYVYNRNKYYTKLLIFHSVIFCFCAILEVTEHLTN